MTTQERDEQLRLVSATQRPGRRAGLVAVEVGPETVIYDPESEAIHLLDPVGSLVWSALDGDLQLDELSVALAEHFGVARDEVLSDVLKLVSHLTAVELVVAAEPA
ncbi:MAG: PqqD family protein [Mycobacteriales bacterium]